MSPREFYLAVEKALQPACDRLALKRDKGPVTRWALELGSGFLYYEIALHPIFHFQPGLGGEFVVGIDVIPTVDPKKRSAETAIPYLKFAEDADLAALKVCRDVVLHKLLSQTSFPDAFTSIVAEDNEFHWELELQEPFRKNRTGGLPYLDAADVTAWSKVLGRLLAKSVQAIQKSSKSSL